MKISNIIETVLCSLLVIALQSCAHLPEREVVSEMRHASSLEKREQERHAYILNKVERDRTRDDPETRWESAAGHDMIYIAKSGAIGEERTLQEGYRLARIMKKKNINESRALQLLIDQANKEGIMNWMMIVLEVYGIPPERLSNELEGERVISPFVRLGSDS